MALFETEWLGGAAEKLFAQHRGDRIEEIQWSGVDTAGLTEIERDRLRTVWTQSAHQEWCAAGAFTTLLQHLLLARAPVDLIGMAGRFVADEMVHVELASRMAMAYGGGVPLEVDDRAVLPIIDPGTPLMQVAALAIRVSCVGESFSLPIIAREFSGARDPIAKAVLGRIAADEAAHAKVGWLVLDWAEDHLSDDDLQKLGMIAEDAVMALHPALIGSEEQLTYYEWILQHRIAKPLARRGVRIDPALLEVSRVA
jgi:hypothetical protein